MPTIPVVSFVLADRSLTEWHKAPFAGGGSPWAASASAGSSGSNGTLSEGTNPPGVSAALNGLTGADFDGTNDKLGNATATTTYLSNAAGSIAILFSADTAEADVASNLYFFSPALFSDAADAFLAVTFTTGGVRLGSYNGTNFNSVPAACATGGVHLAQARWNASVIEIRVDSGAWQTLTRTVVLSGSGVRMGANYNATAFFDGKIYERILEQARWSDAEADQIKSDFNTRYALSL